MTDVLIYIVTACLFVALMFGVFYAAKHLSWWVWYEGLTLETITETVKAEGLK